MKLPTRAHRLPVIAGLLATLFVATPVLADPCGGTPGCYDAGPFTAEVTQVTSSWNNTHKEHYLRLNVRFRNNGTTPIILGFRWRSASSLTDNFGNTYGIDWRFPANIVGIGLLDSKSANSSFVIAPGGNRTASFIFSRWPGQTAVGNIYSSDFSVEQLESIPGTQQVRSAGQFALNFTNLSASGLGANASNLQQDIGNLFKSLTKK